MTKFGKLIIAGALALIGTMATGMEAQARGPKGPAGWQMLCITQPKECVGGGAASIVATEQTIATIQSVNVKVNRAIRPRADGRLDIWSVNVSVGDCEDYALTKRHRLIQAGVSPAALRIAQVVTRRGEYHAILVVRTDKGDFILDNLTSAIRPLSQSPYRMVSMQSANPKIWS